jgi:hypothetical protein
MTYSDAEKIACLRRELAMRRNVYQKRVLEGRMRPEARDREIGLMQAILDDYQLSSARGGLPKPDGAP